MIELTRLNGIPMVLNSDLVKSIESSPDTVLTLINGEKLIVREEIADVVETSAGLPRAAVGGRGQAATGFSDIERVTGLMSLDISGARHSKPSTAKHDAKR